MVKDLDKIIADLQDLRAHAMDCDIHIVNKAKASMIRPREWDVIMCCIDGLVSKQIADRLHLAPRTIEGLKKNVLRKLECRCMIQAVALLFKKGILK